MLNIHLLQMYKLINVTTQLSLCAHIHIHTLYMYIHILQCAEHYCYPHLDRQLEPCQLIQCKHHAIGREYSYTFIVLIDFRIWMSVKKKMEVLLFLTVSMLTEFFINMYAVSSIKVSKRLAHIPSMLFMTYCIPNLEVDMWVSGIYLFHCHFHKWSCQKDKIYR